MAANTCSPDLGFPYVTVYGVALADWCARYDLAPFTGRCPACGRAQRVALPIAGPGGIRGLRARCCPCGSTNAPHAYTSGALNRLAPPLGAEEGP